MPWWCVRDKARCTQTRETIIIILNRPTLWTNVLWFFSPAPARMRPLHCGRSLDSLAPTSGSSLLELWEQGAWQRPWGGHAFGSWNVMHIYDVSWACTGVRQQSYACHGGAMYIHGTSERTPHCMKTAIWLPRTRPMALLWERHCRIMSREGITLPAVLWKWERHDAQSMTLNRAMTEVVAFRYNSACGW